MAERTDEERALLSIATRLGYDPNVEYDDLVGTVSEGVDFALQREGECLAEIERLKRELADVYEAVGGYIEANDTLDRYRFNVGATDLRSAARERLDTMRAEWEKNGGER